MPHGGYIVAGSVTQAGRCHRMLSTSENFDLKLSFRVKMEYYIVDIK